MTSPTPWLTDDEIADITSGLKQAHARKRYLSSLGLTVREKPNGDPLVMRAEFDRIFGDDPAKKKTKAPPQPNSAAVIRMMGRRHQPA